MLQVPPNRLCQSCGKSEPTFTEHYPKLGIYQCVDCESLVYRQSKHLDLSSLYSKEYFEGGEYKDYQAHQSVHRINFSRKWKILKKFTPQPTRLFEVGCAYGFFLEYLKIDKLVEKFYGVDISDHAISQAHKNIGPHFAVSTPGIMPPFRYNCLVAWDVWEHLQNPVSFFDEYLKALEPGGVFAFTTVDSASFMAKMRGPKWRQIHPPTHINYPTKQALSYYLKSLGFNVLYHSHFGYHRALEQYLAALKLDRLPLPQKIKEWPIKLDLKDTQFVIAQKPT